MKPIKAILSVLLAALMLFSLLSCDLIKGQQEQPETAETIAEGQTVATEGLWANAIHLENKEFGEGAKTLRVEVTVEGKTVLFTIHTDKTTV